MDINSHSPIPANNNSLLLNSNTISTEIQKIQTRYKIIGRSQEIKLMLLAIKAQKHIILEGSVGTGKTYLARALAHYTNANFYRIDGSEEILSHILVGYFDPPLVIAKGYLEEAFIIGPLSAAMQTGGCLFINELNRIPESTQNILLTALDERILTIPKFKTITAHPNFITIATQNPAAHVGVSALGEALKDRFLWISVDCQSETEEIDIVKLNLQSSHSQTQLITLIAVKIARTTRVHPLIRRGSSIRGAIDLAQIIQAYETSPNLSLWEEAAVMALHSKIELIDGADQNEKTIILEIVNQVLEDFQEGRMDRE